VQDHDVAVSHERRESLRRGARGALVDLPLVVAQRPAVAGRAVQPVVQALGDVEEVGLTADDEPASIHARGARIPNE
jgi:hypothetical protein